MPPAAANRKTTPEPSHAPKAMQRLETALKDHRARAVTPLLQGALAAVRSHRPAHGAELAKKAVALDGECALAWQLWAVCSERLGDRAHALTCYERALQLKPDDPEIARDLGRLAYLMGMLEIAERLFARYLLAHPGSVEAANDLATVKRDQLQFAEAIEILRPVIYANPERALLWNTLGTVLFEQGEMAQAIGFFDEALRLDPAFARARYNRGSARVFAGDLAGALEDCEAALAATADPREQASMALQRGRILLAGGDLGAGWDATDARLSPAYDEYLEVAVDAPAWTPDAPLAGKSLLVMAEQGLGDELLFAHCLPDLAAEIGEEGALAIAVDHRLVPLVQRSFPRAQVGRHDTYNIDQRMVRAARWADEANLDAWAPLASLPRRYRRSLDAYPATAGYLTPDPARVAHWREALQALGPGPKVGVMWKSFRVSSSRASKYSPFELWREVLATPGVRFVNLQYGDAAADLAQARDAFGVDIWTPPGLDLKDDLDGVAALGCALDLSIGPSTATTNLIGACGGPLWLTSIPGAWTRLGAEAYPWFPQARVFAPAVYGDWASMMAEVAQALAVFVRTPR